VAKPSSSAQHAWKDLHVVEKIVSGCSYALFHQHAVHGIQAKVAT
jgi:hypothetical protein